MTLVKEKNFYQHFFTMMFMLVLQNVIALSVNLADNIMVTSYSETALSGVATVNQLQFVLQQLMMGTGDALVSICSQYWGEGKTEPIKSVAKAAYLVAGGIALIFFAAASLFPYELVHCFSDSEAIVAEGVKYLNTVKYT